MKSSSILSLLAITVSPTLSQPHHAAIDDTTVSAPIHSRADPSICETHHVIITDQLEEIAYLKSRNLPVTHDLGGYYYAIISARRLFGCPLDVLPAPDADTSSASQQSKRSDEAAGPDSGNPCEAVQTLRTQVEEQMKVLDDSRISTPDYLAGWFSATQDLNVGWSCGLPPPPIEPGNNNATVSDE